MSLVENLLKVLSHYPSDYVTLCARLRKYSRTIEKKHLDAVASKEYLRVTLSRLKQRGLVENKKGAWVITDLGLSYFAKVQKRLKLPKHTSKKLPAGPKKMIIVFDIPEDEKQKRSWLRIELSNLDFVMLQKSVWFGPAPLPKKTVKSLNEIKLLPYLKFFKVEEADIV